MHRWRRARARLPQSPRAHRREVRARSVRYATARRARLYRTGDRARWRADGTLEYLGRIDNQVKLRGFRVELGEIETALAQQPGVQSAVVLVREDTPGDQRLVAYCIPVPGADRSGHTPAALRRALKTTLPEFMVPTAFVWLDEWPLNANGKLDRKALPAPATADAPVAARVAPRTPTEEVVAALWGEVLQREVGVEDDFFELGGHSLLALRVLARVGERFGVRVPLRVDLRVEHRRELRARACDELRAAASTATAGAIPRVGDEAPLTHLQELFWLVERNAPDTRRLQRRRPVAHRAARSTSTRCAARSTASSSGTRRSASVIARARRRAGAGDPRRRARCRST